MDLYLKNPSLTFITLSTEAFFVEDSSSLVSPAECVMNLALLDLIIRVFLTRGNGSLFFLIFIFTGLCLLERT